MVSSSASPSAFWSGYERFLLGNAGRISTIESTLRTATYFLPGRFNDAELAGEAVYACLNLLGLYHDSILYRAVVRRANKGDQPAVLPRQSEHNRYVTFLAKTVPGYTTLAKTLTLISSLEILIEMVAVRRWGKQGRWRIVLWLEMIKAGLRLCLMKATNGRLLIRPCLPDREIDPNQLQGLALLPEAGKPMQNGQKGHLAHQANGHTEGDGHFSLGNGAPQSPDAHARLTKRRTTLASIAPAPPKEAPLTAPIPTIRASDVSGFLASKALSTEDILRPGQLVRRVVGLGKLAEILWILRPLLYVAMIRKYGPKHVYPFALSFTLEILSRRLYKQYRQLRQDLESPKAPSFGAELGNDPLLGLLAAGLSGSGNAGGSETLVEKEEMKRRGRAIWYNVFRGPIWDAWTKQRLESVVRGLEGKPILGLVASIARDYLPLYENYYYYSAGA